MTTVYVANISNGYVVSQSNNNMMPTPSGINTTQTYASDLANVSIILASVFTPNANSSNT